VNKRAWVAAFAIFGFMLIVGGALVGYLPLKIFEGGSTGLVECPTALGSWSPVDEEHVASCLIVRGEAKTAGILAISLGVGSLLSSVAVGALGSTGRPKQNYPAA